MSNIKTAEKMNVTLIETADFRKLVSKIESIETSIKEIKIRPVSPTKDTWLDNQQVMELLNISKRLLQTYRDESILPFSKVNNKIYYKASDIQKLLERNYSQVVNF